MMKLFACFCLLTFFSTAAFAGFNDKSLTKFIECDMTSTSCRGIERNESMASVQVGAISRWWEGCMGMQGYRDAFDFTASGQVWFPFTNFDFETSRIALGAGGLYHYQAYKNISREDDLIAFSTFRYQSKPGTTISFYGGYGFKFTKVLAIYDYTGYIRDRYPSMGMTIDKIWSNGFELYFEHALHDLYRYPLFCSPHYALGVAQNMDSGLRFGGELSMRVVDGYAASPYVDSLLFHLSMRYSF